VVDDVPGNPAGEGAAARQVLSDRGVCFRKIEAERPGFPRQQLLARRTANGGLMNEAAWLSCEEPRKLLLWIKSTACDRKLRLFACAFWRWYVQRMIEWSGKTDPEMNRALNYGERWAENGKPRRPSGPEFSIGFRWHPLFARRASDSAAWTIRGSSAFGREWIGPEEEEQQVLLLREIFGNPFRPVAFSPAWRSEAIVRLAHLAYEERAFDRLPPLAIALEKAGCDVADVLAHLREPGPHARGCWALDLVLGHVSQMPVVTKRGRHYVWWRGQNLGKPIAGSNGRNWFFQVWHDTVGETYIQRIFFWDVSRAETGLVELRGSEALHIKRLKQMMARLAKDREYRQRFLRPLEFPLERYWQ
jgi:hypothetical protein